VFIIDQILGTFSHDIAIDLGTANTLVLVRGKGILIREPTVIAMHKKTKQTLAIGAEAKRMLGKTPATITAVRPLKDGVISDFEATEAILRYFIQKVHEGPSTFPKIPRPKVVVGIPSGVTEVERRAVQNAALKAGAREAHLIEEPMAAAIGSSLPIGEPNGNMIVDIGGGTTEIAVISLGDMVVKKSLRIAGDELDQEIITYARGRYNLLLGERTAEDIKLQIGSAYPTDHDEKMPMRGRDLATGLPSTVIVSSAEIREALSGTVSQILEGIKDSLEETPPELVGDILDQGITVTGGGSMLRGIGQLISKETKMPVKLSEDPLTTVVRGVGILLDDEVLLKRVRIDGAKK
jgi:rod shape-determining protein MreB